MILKEVAHFLKLSCMMNQCNLSNHQEYEKLWCTFLPIDNAGVGTRSGIRNFLVLFLTATNHQEGMSYKVQAARLKAKAAEVSGFALRASFHRAAIGCLPDNGEAWHYLGMRLDELSTITGEARQLVTDTLMHASRLLPTDARLWNNVGLVLSRCEYDRATVERCYQSSLELHEKSRQVGCDVTHDLETVALNYGLFLANRDEWEDVLDHVDYSSDDSNQLRDDAKKLRCFCFKNAKEFD